MVYKRTRAFRCLVWTMNDEFNENIRIPEKNGMFIDDKMYLYQL